MDCHWDQWKKVKKVLRMLREWIRWEWGVTNRFVKWNLLIPSTTSPWPLQEHFKLNREDETPIRIGCRGLKEEIKQWPQALFKKNLCQKNKMEKKIAEGKYKIKRGDTRSFLCSIQSREEQGRMMAGIKAWGRLEEMESRVQVKNWLW